MSNNLGRQVKWLDDKGGWHTGRVVLLSDSVELLITRGVNNPPHHLENLVKEDHCGTLTWIETIQLEKWPDVKYCSRCLRPLTSEGICKEQDKCECNKGSWGHTLSTHKQVMEEIVQPIPQSRVTRDEVIKAAIEQIKEEEEALLTANSKLQEEYAEQVIQNQIERNYT